MQFSIMFLIIRWWLTIFGPPCRPNYYHSDIEVFVIMLALPDAKILVVEMTLNF